MNTNQYKVAAAIVILAMATLACSTLTSLPSASSAATSVPSLPTAAALPTATSESSNSGNSGNAGGVLLKDDFSDKSSGWGTGTDATSSVEYAGGGLTMTVFQTDYIVYSGPDNNDYQNVHLEVDVQNNSSDDLATFGVMCDQQGSTDDYYLLGISPNGEYSINKASVGKDDVILTNNGKYKTSPLITKNASSYTIGADCGNGTLTLYVDGKKIDSVKDSTYTKGSVDLFAWNAKKKAGTSVIFDNFVMTSLK